MKPQFTISVFDNLDDLSAEWPSGAEAKDGARHHPFQSKTFLKVWLQSFGRSGVRSLHFVEVRDGRGQPIVFVPLCITRRKGARVLEFIDGEAADYNAPILFETSFRWDRGTAEALWRQITDPLPRFDLVSLSKMPLEIGGLVNPLSLLADRPNEISCHGNDLRRPWAEIEAGIPQRKTLMRKMRNLEKLAPLTFGIANGAGERRAATEAFIRQKQWRFEQTRVPGFDVDVDKHDFFDRGTDVFAQEGMLKLFHLKSGDTILATIWGLTAGRRYYAIMLSFEAGDWAKFSPGSILYYRTLQWLHEQGFEWLDLGIGDEPWKLESCETTFPLTALYAAMTLQGRIYVARTGLASKVRSTALWQAIRPIKWMILRRFREAAVSISGCSLLSEPYVLLAAAV